MPKKDICKYHMIKPGAKVRLAHIDTGVPAWYTHTKDTAEERLASLRKELDTLQELMYAESKHKVLIVFQAMDTAGKDSTIRSVFTGLNPQGVDVVRFKVPTEEELAHDFLWRVHRYTPEKGKIMIFNRSHYEDVGVVKVHNLAPAEVIGRRYHHIREFERMLADEGLIILKFFLHISKDEQKERLQERLDDRTKHWKFRESDLKERLKWDRYMECYQEAIHRTSTSWAPWWVVPSDKKWYRDLVVCENVVAHLKRLDMRYPKSAIDSKAVRIR